MEELQRFDKVCNYFKKRLLEVTLALCFKYVFTGLLMKDYNSAKPGEIVFDKFINFKQ